MTADRTRQELAAAREKREIRIVDWTHWIAMIALLTVVFTAARPWWVYVLAGIAGFVASGCFGWMQAGYEIRARQVRDRADGIEAT